MKFTKISEISRISRGTPAHSENQDAEISEISRISRGTAADSDFSSVASPAPEKIGNDPTPPANLANPANNLPSSSSSSSSYLKDIGIDTYKLRNQGYPPANLANPANPANRPDFTLKSQSADRPTPAAVILERLAAEVRYIADPGEAQEVVARLLEKTEGISRYPGACGAMLGVDIETAPLPQFKHDAKAGLDPFKAVIRLLQVFDPVGHCLVFDCRTVPLEVLKPLIESRETVAHNAIFEMKFLRQAGINPLRMHCTLLMARVASGQPLLSLAKAVERHFPELPPIDKALQTSNWNAAALSAEQVQYAALDAVLARELWRELKEVIKTTGQAAAYRRMAAVIPVVADQTLAGVPFDATSHRALLDGWQAEVVPLREQLQADLGINPDSGPQLAAWLEKHLDPKTLVDWPRTPTGKLKTDEDAFDKISLPALAPLTQYKRLAKKISVYGTGYLGYVHPVTGRIHPEFLIAGTRGGRFSCRDPNLQQAPAGDFRRLFRAPAGYQLVVADYSQVELRIAAILAGDSAMLAAYKAGADLHRRTAAAIAGIAETEVTKAQRQLAKACNFGLIYGMGGKTLAAYAAGSYGVAMSLAEAEHAKAAFFRAYPGIARWQAVAKARGTHDPTVKTAGGLIRDLGQEPGGWKLTQALNTPVQGTGAEMLLAALHRLPKALAGLDAKLILHVHDEVVLEVADRDVPAAKVALEEAMVAGFRALLPDQADMPGLVEAHAGPTWFDAKG